MNIETLKQELLSAVVEFINDEENYSDNVQIQINTETGEVAIADADNDLPDCDYVPAMDLVMMSTENPGQWLPDTDAIDSVAADYVTE